MRVLPFTSLLLCLLSGCSGAPAEPAAQRADAGTGIAPAKKGPALQGVSLTVRNSDDMQLMPARVIIKPSGHTNTPGFQSDGSAASNLAPNVLGEPNGVMLITGQGDVPLPLGSYTLTVLQGPEYELVQRAVTITTGAAVAVDAVLERAMHTDGWLAADMHIHTNVSFDSAVQLTHRVVSEVTAGVELLVPTDHQYHNDLQPALESLSYATRAVAIPGSEYGFSGGHIGVYPVVYDPQGSLFGAPLWEAWPYSNINPSEYFPLIHQLPGQPVIVINHPRLQPDLGYFNNIGWQPGAPLPTAGLFDAMEVLAGYESSPQEVTLLMRDWFTLLNQGRRITGLGNSDTHRVDWLQAGYPRSWLRLATDEPQRLLPADLRDAVLNMRAIGSLGPWVNLTVNGHGLGDTVSAGAPLTQVSVTVEADAPSWIDLTQVQIYQSGVLVQTLPIDASARAAPLRHPALQQTITLPVSGDGWVLAVATGEQPLSTDIIGAVMAGQAQPIAFTNPVWVDGDGDGRIMMNGPVGQPQPFGPPAPGPPPRASPFAPPLETPMDCEPRLWRQWRY